MDGQWPQTGQLSARANTGPCTAVIALARTTAALAGHCHGRDLAWLLGSRHSFTAAIVTFRKQGVN